MKKTLSLVEAREMFGETCYETETGFLVNIFGKYEPNITFVVDKEVEYGADGKLINPLHYVGDKEVTDSMNMDFDGAAAFIFGDFWRSKKGGACFRPRNPKTAKDLLICVSWGGCFNYHRGTFPSEAKAIEGVKYFRRACSNGGGVGYDYWVVPVGFSRILHIDEVDGQTKVDHTAELECRAKAYREKHAKLQRETYESNDKAYRAKLAAEEASRASRDKFISRLTEIQAELNELAKPKKFCTYSVGMMTLYDDHFWMNGSNYLYTEKNLAEAESYLARMRDWVLGEEATKQAKADARAIFQPKYEELRFQIEKIGWELSFDSESALVKDPTKAINTYRCHTDGISVYPYNLDGFESLRENLEAEANRIAEENLRARNTERIRTLLAATELPEDLWFIFEESDDPDSVIRKEVEAIMAAVALEKDEMDMHELCNCGYDRRRGAIYRVLGYVGGGNAKMNIDSQSTSKALAWFIAG